MTQMTKMPAKPGHKRRPIASAVRSPLVLFEQLPPQISRQAVIYAAIKMDALPQSCAMRMVVIKRMKYLEKCRL